MTRQRRRFRRAGLLWSGLLWSGVLAAGMGLATAGCSPTHALPYRGPFHSVLPPPDNPGTRAEGEAFKKEVEQDRFPNRSEVGF